MTYCPHCSALRRELQDLKAVIAAPLAEERQKLREVFGLVPGEANILLALYHAKGRIVSSEYLYEVRETRLEGEADMQVVKVNVSRIRRKLGTPNAIETAHGYGYRITALGKALINQALEMES